MEKINVAKLLKDCPQNIELDCTMFNKVTLFTVDDREGVVFPIKVFREDGNPIVLTKYGQYIDADFAKCVIFPKGKTTWEGFVPPCQFKDGDIIFTHANCLKVGVGNTWISIFKERRNGGVATYVDYAEDGSDYYSDLDGDKALLCMESDILRQRFATEEEKEKLFKAIEDNGYKWNPETKTLEKITQPKFKDGDIIADEHGNIAIYKGTMWYNKKLAGYYCGYRKSDNRFLPEPKRDGHFGLIEELHHATEEEKEKLFQVILDNRYSWNTETKKLEKIFPYNIGTKVWVKSDKEHKYIHTIVGISRNACGNLEYEVKEEKTGIVVHYPKELLIPITKEPQFKIGDIIQDAKDGDVLVDKDNNIGIFQKFEGIYWYSYIYLGCDGKLRGFSIGGSHKQTDVHPATKEQRDLLFQKIKEAGYCWNDKTKILERLIIPQFKVGNRIKEKQTGICGEIISVQKNRYNVKIDDKGLYVYFREQDNWELLPDKFDIATLKPFDRVLVRDNINEKWNIHFFSYIDDAKMFKTIMGTYIQCIPYEGNEHLLGKVEDCKNFYKIWE